MVRERSAGIVRVLGGLKVMLEAAPMVTVIVPLTEVPPADE